MRYLFYFSIGLILFSCSSTDSSSEDSAALMEEEVRHYLFLGDTVDVEVAVVDTISTSELDTLLAAIESNLELIQMDIDTLGSIIDTIAYQNLEKESSVKNLDKEIMEKAMGYDYWQLEKKKLKMAELQAKKLSFKQTQRVMLHLQRAEFNEVAGYEITATLKTDDPLELNFVMDSDYRIID